MCNFKENKFMVVSHAMRWQGEVGELMRTDRFNIAGAVLYSKDDERLHQNKSPRPSRRY
jgi:hypothetical protein